MYANELSCVEIRFCGACESSDDVLSQQFTADPVHDARVPQCRLQVDSLHLSVSMCLSNKIKAT